MNTGGVIQPRVRGVEDILISIFQVSDSFPNAKAMLDFDLNNSKEGHQDFRLLERSPIIMSGNHGERIVYSYYGYHATTESKAETGTAYKAYFDSRGLIWRVDLLADEYAAAERAEADFEHLLEDFKILN